MRHACLLLCVLFTVVVAGSGAAGDPKRVMEALKRVADVAAADGQEAGEVPKKSMEESRKEMFKKIIQPEVIGELIIALRPMVEPLLKSIGLEWSDIAAVVEDIAGLQQAVADMDPLSFLERKLEPHVIGKIVSSFAPNLVKDGVVKFAVLDAVRDVLAIAAQSAVNAKYDKEDGEADEDDDEDDDEDNPEVAKADRWKHGDWEKVVRNTEKQARIHAMREAFKDVKWAPDNRTEAEIAHARIMSGVKAGDAQAMYNYGTRWAEGKGGLVQNDTAAVEWWLKAAKKGDLEAMFNLAIMYEDGRGCKQDDEQALRWYTKAAEGGDAEAQYTLGMVYANGEKGASASGAGAQCSDKC
jgi:hypothetical protein